MKFLKLSIFLSLIHSFCFSQITNEKKITICDSKTKQPIPYATVRAINFKLGTFADSNGVAKLPNEFTDSLYISCNGYLTKLTTQKDNIFNTIYLDQKIAELLPVIVKQRKKLGEGIFGILRGKTSTIWSSSGFGDEFAQKIILTDSNKYNRLKTISIGFQRFDATIPIILHIYKVDADGLPDKDILLKNIVLSQKNFQEKTQRVVMSLISENIILNEPSFFIGVEFLPVASRGKRLPSSAIILTDNFPQILTYTRAYFFSKNKWSQTLSISQKQINPNNLIISITTDILE